ASRVAKAAQKHCTWHPRPPLDLCLYNPVVLGGLSEYSISYHHLLLPVLPSTTQHYYTITTINTIFTMSYKLGVVAGRMCVAASRQTANALRLGVPAARLSGFFESLRVYYVLSYPSPKTE
ncbi:hypothetical protein Hamer_G018789, partial [Homarus americanus]